MPITPKLQQTTKALILLFIINLVCTNCKEIEIILPSPSITLLTVRQSALTTVEVVISVQKGEGQELKQVEIFLEDLTISSASEITVVIPSGEIIGDKQTVKIETGRLNHDFRIRAVLVTDRYTYHSEPMVFRSLKNNFRFYIPDISKYNKIEKGNVLLLNKGERFSVAAEFNSFFNGKIEIKLNRTISLEHALDFRKNASLDNWHTATDLYLPLDIAPGDYELFVYIDGWEFVADKKIRVLSGNWGEIYTRFPGETFSSLTWFLIDDILYIIGGDDFAVLLNIPVWSLDLNTGYWTKHNDFPGIDQIHWNNFLMPNPIESDGKGYILYKNSENDVELWGYDHLNDVWERVTVYPGKGNISLTTFSLDGKLYMGGGAINNYSEIGANDWWQFDFNNKIWIKLKNMPLGYTYFKYPNRSCVLAGNAYVLELPDKLWEYNPEFDLWSFKSKLHFPTRYTSNIITHNSDLYIVGGAAVFEGIMGNVDIELKENLKYSIRNNSWQFMSFLPIPIKSGFIISWKDQLITGLGYYNDWSEIIRIRSIYRYFPD